MMANGTMTNSAHGMVARQELLQQLLKNRPIMAKQDFMGLMAEAEFYNLFRDIFSSLDQQQSGFVKAKELDRVLCGVRDLVSDNARNSNARSSSRNSRKSIIDVDDDEMLIDYEKFSRMLLGSTLL
jgi:calmodulin/calcium-binding protein CML